MKLADVEASLRALNDAEVRYLIVGGLAVVAHGYVRATVDMDIVLDLESENVLRAMAALKEIGYRPLVPVDAAGEQKRRLSRDEKHMVVFQMRHTKSESTRLDIFCGRALFVQRGVRAGVLGRGRRRARTNFAL
jgi:hypothetical protein